MITGPAERRLTRTFQERIAAVGARAAAVTSAAFTALGSYDEADIPRYAARTRPALTAAHASGVRLGTAYYSTLVQIRPPAVRLTDVPLTADPRVPFIAYWNALKAHEPWESAVQSGAARAEAEARNLTTSASRRAGDVSMRRANQRVEGWARNTDASACPWCRGLTQFVFDTAEAADFGHDRCGCSVTPVIRVADVTSEAA